MNKLHELHELMGRADVNLKASHSGTNVDVLLSFRVGDEWHQYGCRRPADRMDAALYELADIALRRLNQFTTANKE